jgi:tetratricopeptide (TPR) repeat protein
LFLFNRHEPQKALSDFGESLRLNPKDPRYLHSLGLARQQIPGEEHLALIQFQKALDLDPNHTPSRYHCGLMLHRLGQLEEAIQVFNNVISHVTDDRLVYESRGLVYQDQGKHRRAVKDFSKAISLDVTIGENYYHRGESLLRLGKLSEALHEFEEARKNNYDQPCLYNARGMTKRKLNQLDDAIHDLDLAISRNPNPEFYLNRSTCYLDVDDPGSAEDDMTEALVVAPNDYRLLQQRGIARYAQHNFEMAIQDLFNALNSLEQVEEDDNSLDKKHEISFIKCEINRYLGYSFANSGDHDRAVERFDIVIELGKAILR